MNSSTMTGTSERSAVKVNGYLFFIVGLAIAALSAYMIFTGASSDTGWQVAIGVALVTAASLILGGLFVVQPNEARVLTLFGKYAGTGPRHPRAAKLL